MVGGAPAQQEVRDARPAPAGQRMFRRLGADQRPVRQRRGAVRRAARAPRDDTGVRRAAPAPSASASTCSPSSPPGSIIVSTVARPAAFCASSSERSAYIQTGEKPGPHAKLPPSQLGVRALSEDFSRPKAPARLAGNVGDHPARQTERLGITVDDAHQHLADDPPADRPELVAVVQDVGLFEDVEPQRCLAGPPVLGEPDLLGGQRGHTEAVRDDFTGGESGRARPRCRSRFASDA